MSVPVDPAYRAKMNAVAASLDKILNGPIGGPRKVGFVLLVFPFGEASHPDKDRMNYISNGANRTDMVAAFKEIIARFEGSDAFPNTEGHA